MKDLDYIQTGMSWETCIKLSDHSLSRTRISTAPKILIRAEIWDKLRNVMPYRQWEVPILVLISVACQVFLSLLSNRRRYSRSSWLNSFLWLAYNGADRVATLALGIISTNLTATEVLDSTLEQYGPRGHTSTLPLGPRIKLQTFWAPFFLLHLGGPDTITAYGMEDNELWRRHLLSLVFQIVLTLNILFEVWKQSSLTALSAIMFAAGCIKYAERTWCLWFASYKRGKRKAEKALYERMHAEEPHERMPAEKVDKISERYFKGEDEAILMLLDTEGMFADAFVSRHPLCKRIVERFSSLYVIRLIEMELEMMYDDLYTKARVILSYTGLALRFVSFLLTCIALILFSLSGPWTNAIPEYSLTLLLFGVSIGLELYAAFGFLTMYRTISWLRVHNMGGVAFFMACLAKLTAPKRWSNSMGQFSQISYFMQNKPKGPLLMRRIFLRRNIMWYHVNHRGVPSELQTFIHGYLKYASSPTGRSKYSQKQLLFVQSNGKVPWDLYIGNEHSSSELNGIDSKEQPSSLFHREFGEMIVFLHLVTELCYYIDRPIFPDKDDGPEEYKRIFDKSRFSKYLSRYLMHLFVVSSDLLPQRTPLSERKYHRKIIPSWEPFFTLHRGEEGDKKKKKREREDKKKKKKKRATKIRACQMFWENSDFIGNASELSDMRFARNLLEAMKPDDVQPPQLERRWEVLSQMWVEVLVHAADQCKGRAHAQHLTEGGELLTHVWVLLGHFGFIDEALLPFMTDHGDDTETDPFSSIV